MYQLQAIDWINEHENIHLTKYLINSQNNEELHTHNFIEIEYIWSGNGYQVVNGHTYYVERGDLIFINIGDTHAYNTEHEMGIVNCLVTPEFFKNEMVSPGNALDILVLSCFKNYYSFIDNTPPKTKFAGKELLEIEAIIECMIEEYHIKLEGYLEILKNYMNIFLSKIFRAMKKSDRQDIYRDMSKITPQVLNYIEEHYSDKLSLQEFAKMSFYTPNYFSKIFKECFGKNFMEYVNEVRIHKAIGLLKETKLSMEEICYSVGYSNKKQFYKVFKTQTGMTPRQYKNKS